LFPTRLQRGANVIDVDAAAVSASISGNWQTASETDFRTQSRAVNLSDPEVGFSHANELERAVIGNEYVVSSRIIEPLPFDPGTIGVLDIGF
jgi:hypothetical protein